MEQITRKLVPPVTESDVVKHKNMNNVQEAELGISNTITTE